MQKQQYKSADNDKEHRLIFLDGNSEVPIVEQSEAAKTEKLESFDPAKKDQLNKNAQIRVVTREQHEKVEDQERNQTLSIIEEKIEKLDDVESKSLEQLKNDEKIDQRDGNEQNERQIQDAEKFISEARNTLEDPYQREIFDVAMHALLPQEKLAYYRSSIVWFNSCQKQITSSTFTPADIQHITMEVFAEGIVFSSFHYNIQVSSGLQKIRNASKADYLLNISEVDQQLSNQAHEKIVQVTKQYLQGHPKVAQIIERQQKEDEQQLNESASDASKWGPDGTYTKYHKSPEEMKKDAAKELQSIIDQANDSKGIKFELQSANLHDKETGERLSVRIVPKDSIQSGQIIKIVKNTVGSFVKEQRGFFRKIEALTVSSDAQQLKECIASIIGYSYTLNQ